MTPQEKELLLKDLCGRLPYGVKCAIFDDTLPFGGAHGKYPFEMDGVTIEEDEIDVWLEKGNFNLGTIKPYLRPMSSMTDEEKKEFKDTFNGFFQYFNHGIISDSRVWDRNEAVFVGELSCSRLIDWLNAHHFDYRGLISMGLALEAKEGMYD